MGIHHLLHKLIDYLMAEIVLCLCNGVVNHSCYQRALGNLLDILALGQ